MDEKELLRSVPLFSELSDVDIASLARLAARRNYPKDTVVFFENEEGDFFFTIVAGRIKVTILGDDGREIILSHAGPGRLLRRDGAARQRAALGHRDRGRGERAALAAPDRLPERHRRQPGDLERADQGAHRAAAARQPPDLDPGPARRLRPCRARDPRHGPRGGPAPEGRPDRLPPRHPPGDRQPHRHHARDRHAHAQGPGAPGPGEGRRPRARATAGLRARLRLRPPAPP